MPGHLVTALDLSSVTESKAAAGDKRSELLLTSRVEQLEVENKMLKESANVKESSLIKSAEDKSAIL